MVYYTNFMYEYFNCLQVFVFVYLKTDVMDTLGV